MTMIDRSDAFVSTKHLPQAAAPTASTGFVGWMRANLFSSIPNSILTIISLLLIAWIIPVIFNWTFVYSVWNADSLNSCREITAAAGGHEGACWALLKERWHQFVFGFYPSHLYWRPVLAFFLLMLAGLPILFDNVPQRGKLLIFSAAYPFIAVWLIWGGLGLEPVESASIGGFLLTMILGVTGITASFPIGILLALGRQSDLLFIKVICVGFIEFIRGVPLITLLFVASTLLNYFLPPGTSFDLILRVIIMVTLFSSAYMAEVIRGGLAALPKGQYEAADALGLNYWQSMRLIILPQALKISIPGIVNNFIGLFKDSTLVSVIGLFDPLGVIQPIRSNAAWNGIFIEPYAIVAVFFFIFCFGMSRYSMYLERKLKAGDSH